MDMTTTTTAAADYHATAEEPLWPATRCARKFKFSRPGCAVGRRRRLLWGRAQLESGPARVPKKLDHDEGAVNRQAGRQTVRQARPVAVVVGFVGANTPNCVIRAGQEDGGQHSRPSFAMRPAGR